MNEAPARDAPGEADAAALARDWITIWESELTALAGDRELHEFWTRLAALWTEAAGLASGGRTPGEPAGSPSPPRPAPPPASPDARGPTLERLAERLAALESRLDALEAERHRARGNAPGDARRRGRRPASPRHPR